MNDFYFLFVGDNVTKKLVIKTNQLIDTHMKVNPLITRWIDVDIPEIKIFLGICMWMGITPFPSIASYWSKNIIYQSNIPQYMCRNRFEILPRTLLYSDNNKCP